MMKLRESASPTGSDKICAGKRNNKNYDRSKSDNQDALLCMIHGSGQYTAEGRVLWDYRAKYRHQEVVLGGNTATNKHVKFEKLN